MSPYIIVGLVLLVIVVFYQVFYNRFARSLTTLLYKDFNAPAFLKKLESPQSKIFMNKKRRFMFYVDAYIFLNDEQKMNELFEKNQNLKFSYGQQVSLNMKLFQFFIDTKNYDQATEHYNNLKQLSSMIKNKKMDATMDNANMLYEVEIKKNPKYLKTILEKINEADNDMIKGIYYYRAAKCAHLGGNQKATDKYLKKSKHLTKKTIFSNQIDKAMKDHSVLD